MIARRGFTLIELLCVVAILTALASIVYPVFEAARGSAKHAVCVSNLRQIYAAVTLYVGDHDDLLPTCRLTRNQTTTAPTQIEALSPYGAAAPIFHCPADVRPFRIEDDVWPSVAEAHLGSSYMIAFAGGSFGAYRAMEPLASDPLEIHRASADPDPSRWTSTTLFFGGHVRRSYPRPVDETRRE